MLTAHPTEVSRKSILNCQMAIARLLDARDRIALTPEEAADNEEALRRGVLTCGRRACCAPPSCR